MSYNRSFFAFHFLLFSFLAVSCRSNDKGKTEKPSVADEMVNLPSENPYAPGDLSPVDISYYPSAYPLLKMKDKNSDAPVARIIYSRPRKRGREIFGENENSLCPYGKAWRLGANEASEIEFFRNVFINNKEIKAGKYSIYCIPFQDHWNIRLNSEVYNWGLQFDSSRDVVRTDVPVIRQNEQLEEFTMVFRPAEEGLDLFIAWDRIHVSLPVAFKAR